MLPPFKHNIPYEEDIYTVYSHKSTVMIINVVNVRAQQCQTTPKNDTKNFILLWYDEETGHRADNILLLAALLC
jgi:hypothetical protein